MGEMASIVHLRSAGSGRAAGERGISARAPGNVLWDQFPSPGRAGFRVCILGSHKSAPNPRVQPLAAR